MGRGISSRRMGSRETHEAVREDGDGGGKEGTGTEPREVRTGGRVPTLPRPWPFRSPHDVRAESLGEATVQQGWEGPGDQLWTPSRARQCVGHLWPGWLHPRIQAEANRPQSRLPRRALDGWAREAPKRHLGGSRSHLWSTSHHPQPQTSGQVNHETIQDTQHILKGPSGC